MPLAILAGILVAFLGGALVRVGHGAMIAANEDAAIHALRAAVDAERRWKAVDADGNALPDFWTGDWSGLFRAAGPDGREPSGLLNPEIAAADDAPLAPTTGPRPRLTDLLPPASYRGYRFRALRNADGHPLAVDGPDDDDRPWENPRAFAFLAFPDSPGRSGKRLFVVREDGVIWSRPAPPGAPPVEDWPAGRMEDAGWKRLD